MDLAREVWPRELLEAVVARHAAHRGQVLAEDERRAARRLLRLRRVAAVRVALHELRVLRDLREQRPPLVDKQVEK